MSESIQERLGRARDSFSAELYIALDRYRKTGTPVEAVELGVPDFIHLIHEYAGLQVEEWLAEADDDDDELEKERPKIDLLHFARRRGCYELFDFIAEQYFLFIVSQPDEDGGTVSLKKFREGGYVAPQAVPGQIDEARKTVEEFAGPLRVLLLFQREQAAILTALLGQYNGELKRVVRMDNGVKSWMDTESSKIIKTVGDSGLISMLMLQWKIILGQYALALLTGAQLEFHASGQTAHAGHDAFRGVLAKYAEAEALIRFEDDEPVEAPNPLHELCEQVYVGATIKRLLRDAR